VRQAALAAVEPGAAVRRFVERQNERLMVAGRGYNLAATERVWVVGAGKAAAAMAAALHSILGDRLSGGLVVTKYGHASADTGPIELIEAEHPLPDEAAWRRRGGWPACWQAARGETWCWPSSRGAGRRCWPCRQKGSA